MAESVILGADGTLVDTNRGIGMGGDLIVAHAAGQQVEQTHVDLIGAATQRSHR